MAVEAVVDNVGVGAGKPLVERRVGIVQHLIPTLEPDKIGGLLRPEGLQILFGGARHGSAVFDQRMFEYTARWPVKFRLLRLGRRGIHKVPLSQRLSKINHTEIYYINSIEIINIVNNDTHPCRDMACRHPNDDHSEGIRFCELPSE